MQIKPRQKSRQGEEGNRIASRLERIKMLVDRFSRKFSYLRLSLTDKCNFKCTYCLPNGYQGNCAEQQLTIKEISRLARAFKEFGVTKIRLTGGEPTLRRDLSEIIFELKNNVGIDQVALTTNGYRLKEIASDLRAAGLDAINISLDSLLPEKFSQICGVDKGNEVSSAVERCLDLRFQSVKINAVLLKSINDNEFNNFIEFVRLRPIVVRFIELMRTADNLEFFKKHHLSNTLQQSRIEEMGWRSSTVSRDAGPAKEFSHPSYLGRIGFISPYSKDFCSTCNRLRVSSLGKLRLCLFGEGNVDLRLLLQDDDDHEDLKNLITTSLGMKREAHLLNQNDSGDMRSLSVIGG